MAVTFARFGLASVPEILYTHTLSMSRSNDHFRSRFGLRHMWLNCSLLVLDADEFILCMDFCVVWDDKRTSSGICFSGLSLMQGFATVTADVDVEPSEVRTG
jgi:hypothetical protein